MERFARARAGSTDTSTPRRQDALRQAKEVNPAGITTTYSGSLSAPRLVIYRLDVVDPVVEQLVYTSDGPEGCD